MVSHKKYEKLRLLILILLLKLVVCFLICLRLLTKCNKGLIFEQKFIFRVSDSLLSLIESLLSNRFQRVLSDGQATEWLPVKTGVKQGSILGLLFVR